MRNLSHGGRLALIRSVLHATPLHLLQVIHPPKSVLITIERIFNGFLWGSYNGRKHIHWSSWVKACFPVAEGGLGVRSLADYVWAFFMKLWWRFRGKSSLWSEYLHGRYCRNLHPTIVPYNSNHSSIWHRLCRIRDVAEPFIFWTLGEGSVSFWHDNWFGEKPLAQLVHRDTYTMESVRYYWHEDRIPVDARIQQKGFSFPSKCQYCEAEETVSHLFIESAAVQGVWQHFAAIFGLCLCDTGSLTHMVHFWRYSTPFHSDLHIRTLISFLILWFTWTQWNTVKIVGTDLDEHTVEGRFTSGCRNGFHISPANSSSPCIVRWHAPSPSWFKLNTDGSSIGNPGLAGAAGIIRDWAGHVHLAYQFALGTGTSVLAELTAVWRGMELALAHGLAPLVVEVDATTVISLLQSRALGKEANGAADHLAKEAASLQLTRVLHHDDITGVLRGILCLDRQGVPHLRRG
ncbi:UNVERIFIED_CONTAM: putative ribonuclease H protein [Sesamum angustifolium]|uniref:Ribonuclease H protein n=1 Tax=Sesamum angustifolium TaxID=2727405 RepID=A0AAW2NVN4_9LAMI